MKKNRTASNRALLAAALIAIAAFAAFPAAAQNPGVSQESIPLDSALYADMDALYLLTGAGVASNDRPWTRTEARMILSRIDRASLSGPALALHDSIAGKIQPGLRFSFPGDFGFGAALEANVEAYWHRNTEFDLESDWVYGFEDRRPLARISLDFSLKDFFYSYCDLEYGPNRFNYLDTFKNFTTDFPDGIGAIIEPGSEGIIVTHSAVYSLPFATNILGHSYDFDFEWPKRAVSTVGGANWNITLARDKISWGNGNSGNFIIDDHVDYHEFARLVAFTDTFKYDWLNVFFQTNPSQSESPDDEFRLLMAHRLEFRILKRITFAISENVMYRNDVFDLRYLNPSYIYHNLNNRSMFNAIAHAELNVAAARGLDLYAQFVMDQARAPNEGTSQSDSNGFLFGAGYAAAAGPGILTTSLEYVHTSPLLYRRDGVDFLMYRKYFTHGNPAGPGYVLSLDYIGYPYGGDAQVLQWDTAYRLPGLGTVEFSLMGMRHGEMDFFMSHNLGGNNGGAADYQGETPSGDDIDETLVASLSAEFDASGFFPWPGASLRAELDWIGQRVYTVSTDSYSGARADLQFTTGMSFSL